MVFNIAKFIEWPAETFPNEKTPLTLCVIGKGPFGQALENLKGKLVHGHPISLKLASGVDDIGMCHILVINDSERHQLQSILERSRRYNMLTISDIRRFAQAGGVIGLFPQDGKIRLAVNLDSAQRLRLKISSQLLKLAKIVQEGD